MPSRSGRFWMRENFFPSTVIRVPDRPALGIVIRQTTLPRIVIYDSYYDIYCICPCMYVCMYVCMYASAVGSLLYWDVSQRGLLVSYRRFGTTYPFHL